MSKHRKTLLKNFFSYGDNFLKGRIDLLNFQSAAEAIYSSFEGDIDPELREAIHDFIVQLELIRFMREDYEQYDAIKKELVRLESFFAPS